MQRIPTSQMAQRNATAILDECFLPVRAKLLEIAATLDRIDRACDDGPQLEQEAAGRRASIDDGIRILLSEGPDRAERMQRLFSRDYEPDWRAKMSV